MSGPATQVDGPVAVVVAGPVRHPLVAGSTIRIGRDPGCDIVVNSPPASRRHVQIGADRSGAVTIRDLGSANGSFVDGRRLDEFVVGDGAVLTLGAPDGPALTVTRTAGGAPRSSITPLATAPARRHDRSRAHRRDRARRRRTGGAGPDDHHRPCPLERHRLGRPARLPAPCAPDRRTPAGLPHRGPLRPQRRPDQRPARPRRQRLPRRRPARHRPHHAGHQRGVASSPPSPPTPRSAPTSWASSSRTTGSARPCSTG